MNTRNMTFISGAITCVGLLVLVLGLIQAAADPSYQAIDTTVLIVLGVLVFAGGLAGIGVSIGQKRGWL